MLIHYDEVELMGEKEFDGIGVCVVHASGMQKVADNSIVFDVKTKKLIVSGYSTLQLVWDQIEASIPEAQREGARDKAFGEIIKTQTAMKIGSAVFELKFAPLDQIIPPMCEVLNKHGHNTQWLREAYEDAIKPEEEAPIKAKPKKKNHPDEVHAEIGEPRDLTNQGDPDDVWEDMGSVLKRDAQGRVIDV